MKSLSFSTLSQRLNLICHLETTRFTTSLLGRVKIMQGAHTGNLTPNLTTVVAHVNSITARSRSARAPFPSSTARQRFELCNLLYARYIT